jgi:phosphoribosyl-ATP pyrophosphohydrolase
VAGGGGCRACFLVELERVIEERLRERPEGSYTARIAERGVGYAARKLGEEAVETVVEALAGSRERLVEEAADLVYHLIVLLRLRGASLEDVVAVLEERAGWRRG